MTTPTIDLTPKFTHFVEPVGNWFQSVFPARDAELSALHHSANDALEYLVVECGIPRPRVLVRGTP